MDPLRILHRAAENLPEGTEDATGGRGKPRRQGSGELKHEKHTRLAAFRVCARSFLKPAALRPAPGPDT
jgi:hypothetical protein